ncbi:glycosyltransferase family 2 protein [Hespellia stercorisuis]|uniref:Glycosyl transferase family 2 n=1 Tax=Hespellia stercorisuis DSM 15480 TaxID=1121950 RepID=A0A1M6Q5E7_9FIRM|nr:glycosyltransferase [Hespellia stercorisuis]SHK15370.1 Glycosyl transferase family 2 [Hespellia stercorisuis DSM 15480]
MNYRIEKCFVYGVLHPSVYMQGWIDGKITKIAIRKNDKTIYEENFAEQRTVKSFLINQALGENGTFEVYLYKKRYKKMMTIHTNVLSRLARKMRKNDESETSVSDGVESHTFNINDKEKYLSWLEGKETFHDAEDYAYQPKISLIIPVYNVERNLLEECLDSILNQTYQNFEICIADDNSGKQETLDTLREYEKRDERIKVVYRKENGHISKATDSALELVTGEFIGLIDNDDMLDQHALNEVVYALNEQKDLDFIYTDEDKIGLDGKREFPHFKSDFALETLYGENYICHFSVIRKTIIDKIGGFREGYEGAQDFDLFLRVVNETKKIHHIPKLLYRWRMIPGSTAVTADSKGYAAEAGKRALEDYFRVRNEKVDVKIALNTFYCCQFPVEDSCSTEVVIFDAGRMDDLRDCIEDFQENLEDAPCSVVILTERNKVDTEKALEKLSIPLTVICGEKRQWIKKLNEHLAESAADCILFLDENTRVLSDSWLRESQGYALHETLGVVGGKVLDVSEQVCESGVVLTPQGKLLPANVREARNSYGLYGRLMVPYNYSMINNKCFMVSREKYLQVGGMEEQLAWEASLYELSLRMLDAGYRNLFTPQLECLCYTSRNTIDLEDADRIFMWKKWKKYFEHDAFYNSNFSDEVPFELETKA